MMALTFADVVFRSIFNTPIEAATELIRIAMAVIVFAALPVISWRSEHISVDLLDRFFSPRMHRIRNGLIQRVSVLAERAASYGDVTEYLGIPQTYVAWMIAISAFITALVFIARGLHTLFWTKRIINRVRCRSGTGAFTYADSIRYGIGWHAGLCTR